MVMILFRYSSKIELRGQPPSSLKEFFLEWKILYRTECINRNWTTSLVSRQNVLLTMNLKTNDFVLTNSWRYHQGPSPYPTSHFIWNTNSFTPSKVFRRSKILDSTKHAYQDKNSLYAWQICFADTGKRNISPQLEFYSCLYCLENCGVSLIPILISANQPP